MLYELLKEFDWGDGACLAFVSLERYGVLG